MTRPNADDTEAWTRLYDIASAPDAPVVELSFTAGGRRGELAVLSGAGPWTLGRDPGCAVRMDVAADGRVSSRHAEISVRDGTVWLRDLASRNGTLVNGLRIVRAVALGDGDTIDLAGDVALAVRIIRPEPPEAAEADATEWRP